MFNKKDRPVLIIISICALLFLLLIINGVISRFGFGLPGKYYLFTNPDGVIIERKKYGKFSAEKSRIGPNVSDYRVYSNVITGKITKHRERDEFSLIYSTEHYERRLGYFIIDLHTAKVYGGLSKEEWIKKLKEYSINDEPKLYKPSFLDGWLGRNKP